MLSDRTRQDIRDLIGGKWNGRLQPVAFLGRLYKLESLPSHDGRFDNMATDVYQHTVANDDWDPDWVYSDSRLGLEHDETFLRFIVETLHPAIVSDDLDVAKRVRDLNTILLPEGHELVRSRDLLDRPVFESRRTTPRRPPTGPFPGSLISGLAKALAACYTATDLDSLFEDQDFPRPIQLGGNKVERVKAWLRTADGHAHFDHWAGLSKVLRPILDEPSIDGSVMNTLQHTVKDLIGRQGFNFLPRGGLVKNVASGELPAGLLPPSNTWHELGKGGFATVYRFSDTRLGIDFAIKVFDPSPFNSREDANARFLREGGLLFRLRHENIIRVFDVGALSDGRPFIRMEYFAGLSLQAFLDRRSLTTLESVTLLGRLTAALEHAHARSIFHRDIKPSNILVSDTLDEARLIDFGLGILVEESVAQSRLTNSSHHFGGAYSAPELLDDSKLLSPQLDIYSLGAIWFRLIAGRAPLGTGIDDSINAASLELPLKVLLRRCLGPPVGRPSVAELLKGLREWHRSQRPAVLSTDLPPDPGQATTAHQIRVQSKHREVGPTSVGLSIRLLNDGPAPVPVGDLRVVYWYKSANATADSIFCDYAAIGAQNLRITIRDLKPARLHADRAAEIRFQQSAGNLAPAANSGEMQLRINNKAFSSMAQETHYSFEASKSTTFVDSERMTLYLRDALIWGFEPT